MPGDYPMPVEVVVQTVDELLSHQGDELLAELLRLSDASIDWQNSAGWQSETDYYTLKLRVPINLFANIESTRDKVEKKVLLKIQTVTRQFENEKIDKVVIVPDRRLTTHRSVPQTAVRRIWGDGYRLFLSHKAQVKKQTAELKESLQIFGVSSFVAHADIRPTKAWQDEIENALATMDGFVALMTADFHDSPWTDQEVGYALAKGVPIIAIKLGKDPYGFIGKFQALSCSWSGAPNEIVKLLIKHDKMVSAYVKAVAKCGNFDDGNKLATIFPEIERLTDGQADSLISAYNDNVQVGGSYGFNGGTPRIHGDGLLQHLRRLTSRNYKVTSAGNIKVVR
jgi:hypothetical protein